MPSGPATDQQSSHPDVGWDELPDGVVVLDHEGRIQVFNAAAERLTRRRRADLAGRHVDEAQDGGLLDAPTAWLFGNEAHGLTAELAAACDHRVRIPIHGRAESLNLATAAAVCLYASARAHRS